VSAGWRRRSIRPDLRRQFQYQPSPCCSALRNQCGVSDCQLRNKFLPIDLSPIFLVFLEIQSQLSAWPECRGGCRRVGGEGKEAGQSQRTAAGAPSAGNYKLILTDIQQWCRRETVYVNYIPDWVGSIEKKSIQICLSLPCDHGWNFVDRWRSTAEYNKNKTKKKNNSSNISIANVEAKLPW